MKKINSSKVSVTVFIFTITFVISSVYLSLIKIEGKEKSPKNSQKKQIRKQIKIPVNIEIVRNKTDTPEKDDTANTKKDKKESNLPHVKKKHLLTSHGLKGLQSRENEESKFRPKKSLPKTNNTELAAEVRPKKSKESSKNNVKPETVVIDFSKKLVSDGLKFINDSSFPLIYNDFSEIGIHQYLKEMINHLKGRLFLVDFDFELVAELNSELEVVRSKSEIKNLDYLSFNRPRDITSELKEKLNNKYKFEYISLVMPTKFEAALLGGIHKALGQEVYKFDALFGETKKIDGSLAFIIKSGELKSNDKTILDIRFPLRRF